MDIRSAVKRGRRGGAWWVAAFDLVRPLLSAAGRSETWTRLRHRSRVHQTTTYTEIDRYPDLMTLAVELYPEPARILSFGCSTGEELLTLRRYFPNGEIVGAEINARSRRIAKRRVAGDSEISVVAPDRVDGSFGIVFALAVLQREPHKIAEMEVEDLSGHYPFKLFDDAVSGLVDRLEAGGLLCVTHAHYPVEIAAASTHLQVIARSPLMDGPLFGADGRRLATPTARTIFRKKP